ncbi:MAG: hypothetical protein ACYCWW_17700 [Deltaproteobacteria bacterium]
MRFWPQGLTLIVAMLGCATRPAGRGGSTAGAGSSSAGASSGAATSGGATSGIACPSGCSPTQICVSGSCQPIAGGTGTGGATGGSSGGSTGASLCGGSPIFCDDFTNPALSSSYTTYHGSWVRQTGSFDVTDATAWERPRATLADDASDFDVTFAGHTLGDYGFGLLWAASPQADDGYAVIVHPAQFQGVYLKQLVPGAQDIGIASAPLPPGLAGTPMTVRILRQGSQVTVWLNGSRLLSASDGAGLVHGRLGLLCSDTDQPTGSGADFELFRVDAASSPGLDGGSPTTGGTTTGGTTTGGTTTGGTTTGGTTTGGTTTGGTTGGTNPVPNGPTGTFALAFDDEFDGSVLDASKWNSGWLSCPTSAGVGDTSAITVSQQAPRPSRSPAMAPSISASLAPSTTPRRATTRPWSRGSSPRPASGT